MKSDLIVLKTIDEPELSHNICLSLCQIKAFIDRIFCIKLNLAILSKIRSNFNLENSS